MEVEVWVVDERGRLCDGHDLADAADRIEPEFVGPLLEVQTDPHETESALRRDLEAVLEAAIDAADDAGKRLVPLGTPLSATDAPAATERGRLFERIYGEGVLPAKNCAGTHVHFEQGNVRRQLALLTALDPALALVSSSPYYRGRRGTDCSRAHAYRRACGGELREFCELWEYPESVEAWSDRVDECYERFLDVAADRGVRPSVVEEWFCPEDAVLNPVRLRRCQPTVEWRAPDATLPGQVVDLAFDVARLVEQTDRKPVVRGKPGVHPDRIRVPDFPVLKSLSNQAIGSGLASGRVRDYLERFGFDVDDYSPLARRLGDARTIDESTARELRLAQAERLREDVAGLTDSRAVAPLAPEPDPDVGA